LPIIQLNPQFTEAYIDRGISYGEQKENAKAIADFNQVIQLSPKMAIAYYDRGVFYRLQEQYPQAKVDLEKAKGLFQTQKNTDGYEQTVSILKQLPYRIVPNLCRSPISQQNLEI
jgi:tetratricopeptide (TPR) repeat protein